MPFDEEDTEVEVKSTKGLKNVSSQKSILDKFKKPPSQNEFTEAVKNAVDRNFSYKERAADLAIKFKKMMSDKTLLENKNIFSQELEKEVLVELMKLAEEINTDPNEKEGMGSLTLISLLLKTLLAQRELINNLEYKFHLLEKKINTPSIDK